MKKKMDLHEQAIANHGEMSLEQLEVAGLSQGQVVRRRFRRHKGAMTSLVVLALVVVTAVSSIGWGAIPGWYKWQYYEFPDLIDPGVKGVPSLSIWPFSDHFAWGLHPFGQDESGRDLFAAVMRGTQQTLVVIVVMGLMSAAIGILMGALAGYYRGWVDAIIMRFTDLMITLPILMVVAVLGYVVHASGIWSVTVAMGLMSWTGLARLVRAEFLSLREREFIDAAKVAGASDIRIIFKHIMPNAVGVIVVNVTLLMGGGILLESALGFLGFGIKMPDVSLGSLISAYAQSFSYRPWLFVWPGVMIITIVLCINFIGDGLRDAFDPRQKRVPKPRDLDFTRHVRSQAQGADTAGAAAPTAADGASA